jgi:thiol-disulfide isomerase/thioredoxin
MNRYRPQRARESNVGAFLRSTAGWTALAGLLLSLAACNPTAASESGTLLGSPAPSLSGPDLTGTGITDLASLEGKPTAVVFWLNTCPHCQSELPAIEAAWPSIAPEANILTVGLLNPELQAEPAYETTRAFVETTGLTLPTIDYDPYDAVENWGLEGVPAIFILDSDHIVRAVFVGEGHMAEVEQALTSLASG